MKNKLFQFTGFAFTFKYQELLAIVNCGVKIITILPITNGNFGEDLTIVKLIFN